MSPVRQTMTGIALALLIVGGWAGLHVYAVFFHPLAGWGLAAAPALVLALCWLGVGLFIVAHDAMHGSLAPRAPRVNAAFGGLALALYAGFSYRRLRTSHFAHHRHAGTADDPDFDAAHPRAFWPWYRGFVGSYFGLREFAILTAALSVYLFAFGARPASLLLFWAVPAWLSSLQLFLFGTYLPHRHEDAPFADHHRARSTARGRLASLLACFHFGYHLEHHRAPGTPWWALPAERVRAASPR